MSKISEEIFLEQVTSKYWKEFLELCEMIDVKTMNYCPEIVSNCLDEKSSKFLLNDYYDKFKETNAPDMFIFYKKQICGIIGYSPIINDKGVGELGFWVAPHFQRKGIISSCIPRLIEIGLEKMSLSRVKLLIEPENIKSISLANKIGFTQGKNRIENDKEYCLFFHEMK